MDTLEFSSPETVFGRSVQVLSANAFYETGASARREAYSPPPPPDGFRSYYQESNASSLRSGSLQASSTEHGLSDMQFYNSTQGGFEPKEQARHHHHRHLYREADYSQEGHHQQNHHRHYYYGVHQEHQKQHHRHSSNQHEYVSSTLSIDKTSYHPAADLAAATRNYWYYQSHPEPHPEQHYAPTAVRYDLAHMAARVADSIGTSGNCAFGTRLTLRKFGLDLPAVYATKQGDILEHSKLFRLIPRSEVQPGDYGYRHWNEQVKQAHGGVDKGDAFFVSAVGPRGQLYGSNDHRFVVPGDGGRYRHTLYLRPTAEFARLYGGNNALA